MTELGRFTYKNTEFTVSLIERKGKMVKSWRPSSRKPFPADANLRSVTAAYKRWLARFESRAGSA